MAQSPTIAIPKKKTDDVDWTSPIRSIIAQSYGESPDNYASECAALQRCRQDAVKGAGSDMTARDLLYKYFGQLELLELRFSEIKVTFPWYDAFTTKLTTQTSLAYEKASIIFQMAATHSAVATTQNRSDPEGLKRSFHYFRTSAGMLTYINDNFLHAPSTDLSRDVVKLLVGIMLAQATEVFFEKLIDEKKSGPPFNAKVAAQAAFLYNGLVEDVKEFYGKGIFDRNWVTLLQIKAKYFTALMHYHQYIADTSKGRYGDALARIQLAENLAKEANKLAVSFSSYFIASLTPEIPADGGSAIVTLTKTLSTLTSEKRAEAQRENDLIYNAVPVAEATLPAIDKLVVATPIPIQEVYGSPDVQKVIGPDLFAKLVPLSVHKSASIYSEEKAKVARSEAEKSDEADENLAAGLESLGLPAGLQKWKDLVAGDGRPGSGALPRELEQWAEEIEETGGVQAIDALINGLGPLRGAVTEDLAAVGRGLESESRECERMRIKYEHEWMQDPSAPLTRTLREELKSLTHALNGAAATDEQVVKLWNSARPDIGLLLSGSDNLERFFADQERAQGVPGSGQGSLLDLDDEVSSSNGILAELGAQVAEIDEALGRLNKIKRERGEVLKDLKEKIQTDDVSHLLLVNHRAPNAEQAVFATELEKFRPYQARLAATISHQDTTLEEIGKTWNALKSGRGRTWVKKAEAVEKRRGNLIGRFVQAREGWLQVREGVGKGAEFYSKLGELIRGLRKNVDDFVKPRNAERESMASQLETKRRLTSPSVPEAPPARPAPPGSAPSAPSYDLSGSLSSMSISSPPPTNWGSVSSPPPLPPSRPPPPPGSSVYSSLPPPPAPPRQPSYSGAPSYGATPQSPTSYGLPPPPPPPPSQNQLYASSPAVSDPYESLFSATGLSSQFALNTQPPPAASRQPSLPPPPPPPPSVSQSYYGAPPQPSYQSPPPHPQYSTYPQQPPPPPAQYAQQPYGQPYQQQAPQQPYQYGVPPPPPNATASPPPPPPGSYGQQWGSAQQQYPYGPR